MDKKELIGLIAFTKVMYGHTKVAVKTALSEAKADAFEYGVGTKQLLHDYADRYAKFGDGFISLNRSIAIQAGVARQ